MVELTFVPCKQDSSCWSIELPDGVSDKFSDEKLLSEACLLSVNIQGVEDVEGEHHCNPYALALFR